MTRNEALDLIGKLYRTLNQSDAETSEPWQTPAMAGTIGCALLDKMLHGWVAAGILTAEQLQCFYDNDLTTQWGLGETDD